MRSFLGGRRSLLKPCFQGSESTVGTFLAGLASIFDKHKLTHDAKDDLFAIMKCTFFADNPLFPGSTAAYIRTLRRIGLFEDSKEFFFCPSCGAHSDSPGDCLKETCIQFMETSPLAASDARFQYVSPVPFIKKGLESGLLKTTKDLRARMGPAPWKGILYQNLMDSSDETLLVLLHSDAAQTSLSSVSNIWLGQIAFPEPTQQLKWHIHTIFAKPSAYDKNNVWKEPRSLREDLHGPLLKDLIRLENDGLLVKRNGVSVRVKIRLIGFVSDSAERMKILNIATHNAAYGCCACENPGQLVVYGQRLKKDGTPYNMRKRAFPIDFTDVKANALRDSKRSRELAEEAELHYGDSKRHKPSEKIGEMEFEDYLEPEEETAADVNSRLKGIKGRTLLRNFAHFDEYRGTPVEPMHMIFVGIIRNFLTAMVKPKGKWKLTPTAIRVVDDARYKIKPNSCFQRTCRSIKRFKEWKANECYQFAMYDALVVLHGVLPDERFDIFARFITLNQFLFSGRLTPDNYPEIAAKMIDLCCDMQRSLGETFMIYNVHQWCFHFPQFLLLHGAPHLIWAFEAEGHIRRAKSYLKNPKYQAKELATKLLLHDCAESLKSVFLDSGSSKASEILAICSSNKKRKTKRIIRTASSEVFCHDVGRAYESCSGDKRKVFATILADARYQTCSTDDIMIFERCTLDSGVYINCNDSGKRCDAYVQLVDGGIVKVRAICKIKVLSTEKCIFYVERISDLPMNYFGIEEGLDEGMQFYRKLDLEHADSCLVDSVEIRQAVMIITGGKDEKKASYAIPLFLPVPS